jgi:hypothetical protein
VVLALSVLALSVLALIVLALIVLALSVLLLLLLLLLLLWGWMWALLFPQGIDDGCWHLRAPNTHQQMQSSSLRPSVL